MQFNIGEHGFRAVAPSFRSGLEVEPSESVHVYELTCKLLGIVPEASDGHLGTPLPTPPQVGSAPGLRPFSCQVAAGGCAPGPARGCVLGAARIPDTPRTPDPRVHLGSAGRRAGGRGHIPDGEAGGAGGQPRGQDFSCEVSLGSWSHGTCVPPCGHVSGSFPASSSASPPPSPHATLTLTLTHLRS